jgi:hypothetical protein
MEGLDNMELDGLVEHVTRNGEDELALASAHRSAPELEALLRELERRVRAKVAAIGADAVDIRTPDWSRANPELAGQWHADLILHAYTDTYALPNKYPKSNTAAIEGGDLDMWFLVRHGEPVGTACVARISDGVGELGRSAGKENQKSGLIIDLRIIHWLTNEAESARTHTLFTTLRTAPDRDIPNGAGGTKVMRGGQAVTHLWRNLPALRAIGAAPLYKKAGELEHFMRASFTRSPWSATELFVDDPGDQAFAEAWIAEDGPSGNPPLSANGTVDDVRFTAHLPADDPDLEHVIHADVVPDAAGGTLEEVVDDLSRRTTPFIQVSVPIDADTQPTQRQLRAMGFETFGLDPSDQAGRPALLFGRVKEGVPVVPTDWDAAGTTHPFWSAEVLRAFASRVAASWTP